PRQPRLTAETGPTRGRAAGRPATGAPADGAENTRCGAAPAAALAGTTANAETSRAQAPSADSPARTRPPATTHLRTHVPPGRQAPVDDLLIQERSRRRLVDGNSPPPGRSAWLGQGGESDQR